jgi:hypothetical protein
MTDNSNRPKLVEPAHDEAPISIEKPTEGGLERFKSKRAPNIAGVETLLTALPHHKIGRPVTSFAFTQMRKTIGPRNIASSTSRSSARNGTCCI